MYKQTSNKKGFTLAEVLVTLAVIGIVAAMTIPALLKNFSKTQYVSAVKKMYSSLAQAHAMILADKGSISNLCSNNECLKDLFAQKLKGVKECDVIAADGACWHKSNEWYVLDGTPLSGFEVNQSALIGSDGSLMVFNFTSQNCTSSSELTQPVGCGRIRTDINGFKGPNTVGRDIFDFHILDDRILPRGTAPLSTASCGGSWGCAYKVLSEGKMNY